MSTERFHYTIGGGAVDLPPFSQMPVGIIRKTRKITDEGDKFFTILESICTEDDLALIDTLTGDGLAELMAAWTAHSGVSLPESSASSTS